MASVDQGLADYLKSPSLLTSAAPGGVAWGDKGIVLEMQSALDAKSAAQVEAARLAAFLGGAPVVKDRVTVKGRRRDLLLKTITLTGNRLGYTAFGLLAFVIGVVENDEGTTSLTVLRKLT